MYIIIDKANRCIGESNGNKYLTQVSTDKNRENLTKYTKIWDKIKDLINSTAKTSDDYNEKCMKIKFNSDDDLPLGKRLNLHNMTIVLRSVFQEDKKYYPQVFSDVCINYKC